MNAVLNYAVKYCGLPKNPGKAAGSIGSSKTRKMDFWTHDEFKRFIAAVDNPCHVVLFNILYYGGLRCGEALALTPADVDMQKGIISVTKTYHRMNRKDVITTPKTEHSNREVPIPAFLVQQIGQYISRLYGISDKDRLFPMINARRPLKRACARSGVKQIRVHDIRHSHVSLLIELDFPAILIAERIGDTVQMVNTVYGHLYPNKHGAVADRLQELVSN